MGSGRFDSVAPLQEQYKWLFAVTSNNFFFLYGFSCSGNWDPEVEHMNLAHILSHEHTHFTTHTDSQQ